MQSLRNKITGKTRLRYHFEIVPKSAEGIQCQNDVSVVCESGSKISYTEPKPIGSDGVASFSSVMRMTATIYRDKHTLLPKEYTFKLQSVRPSTSSVLSDARRKTIARGKINLADYCTHSSTPAAAEVQLPLKPQGALNLSIRAVWLQHYPEEKHDERGSESDSAADLSSQFSSASGDSALAVGGVDRSNSVNLDNLADYHQHHTGTATAVVAARSPLSVTPALTAHYTTAASHSPQRQEPGISSTSPLRMTSVSVEDTTTTCSSSSGRHRRTVSTPATLPTITPILEHDREGLDPAGSLDRTVSAETLEAHSSHAQPLPSAYLGPVREDSTSTSAAAAAAALAATAAAAEDEPSSGRSLSLPAWMWPFGSNSVRGVTTDQLMRQIEASAADAPKLQQMCKALLCERNDWRYKATQWERNTGILQQQVDQLQQAKRGLMQQLQSLENHLQQLQTNSLVDQLVEAKLQLAQAQEQTDTLEVVLNREKDRSRRLAAQLTAVESKYAMLYEQQAAAAAAGEARKQQTAPGMSGEAAAAEPGDCLQASSPTPVGSALALVPGHMTARRGTSTAGWGSMIMRAGSYVMGGAGHETNQQQQQQQQQQGSVRRVSEPSIGQGGREHCNSEQHTPRMSAS